MIVNYYLYIMINELLDSYFAHNLNGFKDGHYDITKSWDGQKMCRFNQVLRQEDGGVVL